MADSVSDSLGQLVGISSVAIARIPLQRFAKVQMAHYNELVVHGGMPKELAVEIVARTSMHDYLALAGAGEERPKQFLHAPTTTESRGPG